MERTLFTDSTGQDRVLNLRFHRGSRIRYRADSLEELMAIVETFHQSPQVETSATHSRAYGLCER